MPRLTPKQAAESLGISERKLKNWRLSGNGPSFMRLSHKTVRYDSDVLDAFCRARTRQPSVQASYGEDRRVHIQEAR